jgi:hypothetical protein
LGLSGAGVHLEVKDLVEFVAFGHVFDFLFGRFLEQLKLVDFRVNLVDEIVVFVHSLVERLPQSGNGLIKLLTGDEMILALDH